MAEKALDDVEDNLVVSTTTEGTKILSGVKFNKFQIQLYCL